MTAVLPAQLPRSVAAAPKQARADIQALRAIAVGLVVVYHFFPKALPGGFVGVDVFFVISGFLITAHLIEKPPRTARDLASFWGRRIRRLLPASFVVLAATLSATLLFAPQTVWTSTLQQIAASALYVQNWFLAGEAIDYLAADNAASPVQHFWSLSVEEQFYLFWPILVLIAGAYAAKRLDGRLRFAVGITVAVVAAVSLVVSVVMTQTDPASAYFVTWTRIWELGVGALAACCFPAIQRLLRERTALRTAFAYLGLAGILVAGLAYSKALPFPGITAALPVFATALVLVAAVEPGRFSPHPVMSWRPVQVAGDLSYSIYLWHWPILILLPYALDRDVRGWEKLIVIAAVVVLAWATKKWVEDTLRGTRPLGAPLRRSFIFAGVGMLAFSLVSFGIVASVKQGQSGGQLTVDTLVENGDPCFGARALVNDASCGPHGEALRTDPVFTAEDKPEPYRDGCWVDGDFSDMRTCEYGSDSPSAKRVALVGNSHAGHWLPALQEIDRSENWHITTYLISECYTVDVVIQFDTDEMTNNCSTWNKRVIEEIERGDYDLVVFSNRTARLLPGTDRDGTMALAKEAFGRVLDRWSAADVPVLVLRDTPYAFELQSVPDCVAEAGTDLAACDGDGSRKVEDPLAEAAADRAQDSNIRLLDLTDRICSGDVCQSVVGGVIVYFDRGHLSATFARTLGADISAAARKLM